MPEESVASPAAVAPPLVRLVRWSCEIVLMTAIFAAAGAWPTPDTNEAHYLARARHSWDPSWGAGDFFLDSPEAHGVFYRLLGPLAASLPLDRPALEAACLRALDLARERGASELFSMSTMSRNMGDFMMTRRASLAFSLR